MARKGRSYGESRLNAADGLREHLVPPEPFALFGAWFEAAAAAGLHEPHAMVLATVGHDGRPSARTVLLRAWDARGFVFYTNYDSRKGLELAANPRAALLFHWNTLERQVRVEGAVVRVSDAESDAYFRSRPRGHRLGAWASPQSGRIGDRSALEARMRAAEERFPDAVPRPPYWGGFRVVPESVEFWQGRTNRLHDRILYQNAANGWEICRLAP